MPASDPVERRLTELFALIQGLRQRWQQEKIVLMAHSRASLLGLMAVARDPSLFFAYAGVSQLVHPARNDRMVYDIALQGARQHHHGRMCHRLEAMGPPPYPQTDVTSDRYLFNIISRYCPQKRPHHSVNTFLPGHRTRRARQYGRPRGLEPIYPDLADLDLSRSATRIQVAVMLLTGRYDCISMPYLAQHYFNRLHAPRKTFVWFERSGHDPQLQEPQKCARMMNQLILDSVPR
jgi:pimeloyl-ACP methyl ester carboxylesterase